MKETTIEQALDAAKDGRLIELDPKAKYVVVINLEQIGPQVRDLVGPSISKHLGIQPLIIQVRGDVRSAIAALEMKQ